MRYANDTKGFVLVEMLFSLIICSLILGLITNLLLSASRLVDNRMVVSQIALLQTTITIDQQLAKQVIVKPNQIKLDTNQGQVSYTVSDHQVIRQVNNKGYEPLVRSEGDLWFTTKDNIGYLAVDDIPVMIPLVSYRS